jgi:enoyl-[acyl-carrier protein] reductase III
MSPFDIAGKIVLVTGGTRGLGGAISLHLAKHGAKVVAGYAQNESAAAKWQEAIQSQSLAGTPVRANLMTSTGIQSLVDAALQQFGRLDALVYASATGVHKPLSALTQRHLMAVWQVNVGAFLDLSVKCKPHMPTGSSIVAISSEGAVRAIDQYGSVGSSKGALEALCRQMAAEWAPEGVRVNVVSPGLLETDTFTAIENAPVRIQNEIAASPLGRLVTLEEVATTVHFLCSGASNGLIGQTLSVDGGKKISGLVSTR